MCSARAEISEKKMVDSEGKDGSLNSFNVWSSSFKVVNSPQSRDGDRNEPFRVDSIGRQQQLVEKGKNISERSGYRFKIRH
jgi:hypothetical protein